MFFLRLQNTMYFFIAMQANYLQVRTLCVKQAKHKKNLVFRQT